MPVSAAVRPGLARAARAALRAALPALALLALLGACRGKRETLERAAAMTGGDPARGPALMRKYGCVSCHTVPGIRGADATVGPPLAGIASRSYIGGVVTNSPENMIRWIEDPKRIDSLTAMPNTGVTDPDAHHIAAYLYTLR